MWVPPLLAALVAAAFTLMLARQYVRRRRPYQALWALALAMFAAASFVVFLGVLNGWSVGEFRVYWLLGAVLTVPFLAQGEVHLLVKDRRVAAAVLLVLVFGTAFAISRIRSAQVDVAALSTHLPSGTKAFRGDRFVLQMARLYSIPAYVVLVAGTLWSAWRMRGRPDLRDRFAGTLAIAVGATVVAAGSAFAATGNSTGFSLTLAAGIAVMFYGFLRASRPGPARPEQGPSLENASRG
jgi:MFS family permease